MAAQADTGEPSPPGPGHSFNKKTFHKPTYCHHCTDMLWGLIQQGYTCESEFLPPLPLFFCLTLLSSVMGDDRDALNIPLRDSTPACAT
ncbi:unnamed protein product [Darwinula stevensoni]|uniref:Phorbol-ester/DAG-type domain-containing protein n=1 Tax=Darwinula stevensoni TaxID=69355 RepID=A0A7R8X852_9CRUS|nr:unnamed protein product [Darwinula stevensoni]CAG0882999.1 unnamed protein product [Darwinula stevensoni]